MSLRTTDPTGTQPKRRLRVPLIAALAALLTVAALAVAVGTGVLRLPFLGSPTVTEADQAYGWALTIPTAWTKKQVKPTGGTTIRYQSQGDGVGVRVQAQFLTAEMPPDGIKDNQVTGQLKALVAKHGPDVTIQEGPTFGSVRGVPYVHYLYTFTDFSSGVAILLEDSDYYLFNGAKLEAVTFETTAARYRNHAAEFTRALQTFRSRHMTEGATPSPSGPAGSASPSPKASASPAASPAATKGR